MSKWISVDQELPPEGVEVLTILRTGRHSIREVNGFGWVSRQGRFTTDKVTHWQPLPAPPDAPVTETPTQIATELGTESGIPCKR